MQRRRLILALAVLAGSAPAAYAHFHDRYQGPIIVLVSAAPGGATDTVARLMAERLGRNLGHSVVVENRAGASGNLAMDYLAKARPEQLTVLIAPTSTLTVNPSLFNKLPFDPQRDVKGIIEIAQSPYVLVSSPDLPTENVKDLVTLSKRSALTGGSSGSGTGEHLTLEMFKSATGAQVTHVPYKGGAALVGDLVAKQINLSFASAPSVIDQVKAGKLRALAVTGGARSALFPSIATMAEAGVPGVDSSASIGAFAAAAMPREVVAALNAEIAKILKDPEVRDRLLKSGLEVASPKNEEAFNAALKAGAARWGAVVKASGAKAD